MRLELAIRIDKLQKRSVPSDLDVPPDAELTVTSDGLIRVPLSGTGESPVALNRRFKVVTNPRKQDVTRVLGQVFYQGETLFVVEVRRRRSSCDVVRLPVQEGVNIIKVPRDTVVNQACPLVKTQAGFFLCVKMNGKRRRVPRVVIVCSSRDQRCGELISNGRHLVKEGRCVELDASVLKAVLYVDASMVQFHE